MKSAAAFQFDLSGGHPALNFANTISRRDEPERRSEHLTECGDLISFAVQEHLLSAGQAKQLRASVRRSGKRARPDFRRAIGLRESIYRVFTAIVQGKPVAASDLNTVSDYALEGHRHRRLVRANGSYRWESSADGKDGLDRILWPIAQAAADLLTCDELKLVRWCEAPDCQWLFLDRSRNRSRRWCDMASCGNRAKARRHYERSHQ